MRRIIVLLRGNINFDARVQKEIDSFLSSGFKVTLVTWNSEPINYKKEGTEIININLGNQKNAYGKIFTFLNIIRFWFYASKLIKKKKYDYIHCNDLDTLGIVYFLPKRFHRLIIYDAHELFPERYPVDSIRYKAWNYIEKKIIKKAAKIISPEDYRARYLEKKHQLKKRIYVINNFPKYNIINKKDLRRELNLPMDSIILNYMGVIKPSREIEAIIEALNFLPLNYYFVISGYADDINYEKKLIQFIHETKLTNRVFFYGNVAPSEALQTIAGCNMGIALYKNTNINNLYCAPNKVFDYIMAGIKLITNDYPSLQMLGQYKFVRLISEVNPETIAKCAIELANGNYEVPDAIKRHFCWESFNKIFKDIYC